jgi:hypothetical protein
MFDPLDLHGMTLPFTLTREELPGTPVSSLLPLGDISQHSVQQMTITRVFIL